jgi:hypothetical protein
MNTYNIKIKHRITKEHRVYKKDYFTFSEAFQFAYLESKKNPQQSWEIIDIFKEG